MERIKARVRAGHDPFTAATEEVQRAVAQVDAVDAACSKALAALPTYSKPGDA